MSHVTVAVSERSTKKLFDVLRDNFHFSKSDSASFAGFTANYSVEIHLEGGVLDLRDDNSISIKELDIKYDKLEVGIGFNIPEICVGGWCIPMPWPIPDICLPEICVFSANPDIYINPDFSTFLTHEISFTASPVINYRVDPGRLPTMTDLDAEFAGIPNKWQLFIDPVTIDVDVFDFADIVGNILMNAVENAIDGLLGWLPGWVKDLVMAILGPIIDLVRSILDLPDDVGEWLSDLLGVSFGLFNTILTFVADHFASKYPLHELEDPFPLDFIPRLPFEPPISLIPVKIPIRDLSVRATDVELILSGNVGA
ncbi:MAG: hypothetical protein WCB31_00575 [Nitrososphaeraceae archaeon]